MSQRNIIIGIVVVIVLIGGYFYFGPSGTADPEPPAAETTG